MNGDIVGIKSCGKNDISHNINPMTVNVRNNSDRSVHEDAGDNKDWSDSNAMNKLPDEHVSNDRANRTQTYENAKCPVVNVEIVLYFRGSGC